MRPEPTCLKDRGRSPEPTPCPSALRVCGTDTRTLTPGTIRIMFARGKAVGRSAAVTGGRSTGAGGCALETLDSRDIWGQAHKQTQDLTRYWGRSAAPIPPAVGQRMINVWVWIPLQGCGLELALAPSGACLGTPFTATADTPRQPLHGGVRNVKCKGRGGMGIGIRAGRAVKPRKGT